MALKTSLTGCIVAALAALSMLPLSMALNINIGVRETVNGSMIVHASTNYPQEFRILWSNTGSAECLSRARVTIYDSSGNRVFTGWSPRETLMPSQEAYWSIYSDLVRGNYTAKITAYHCNEVFERSMNLTVPETGAPAETISISGYYLNNTHLTLLLKSGSEARDVAIIPEDYPAGWIVGQAVIPLIPAGQTRAVSIPIRPVLWNNRNITISAVTTDGKYSGKGTVTISLNERGNVTDVIVPALAAALLIIIIYLYHRGIKLSWKKQ